MNLYATIPYEISYIFVQFPRYSIIILSIPDDTFVRVQYVSEYCGGRYRYRTARGPSGILIYSGILGPRRGRTSTVRVRVLVREVILNPYT